MKSKFKKLCNRINTATLMMVVYSSSTFAAYSGKGGNKLVSVFDNITDFLTSTLARGVGITAIAAVGYLYLFQNKIDKVRAISICASIGIILGASSLYDTVVGS